MPRHTILLVEDDPHARGRIRDAIEQDDRLRLIGAAGTLADGLALLRSSAPDVLVTDLGLPDGSGIDLIRAARGIAADTQIMVVTVFGDEKSVLAAIEAGARGYLLKDAEREYVVESILQLVAGGSPISPPIARTLLRRFQEPGPQPDDEAGAPRLSERESEVLELVVKGFTFPEIAGHLSISAHTVTTHVRRIYRKLEVRSRAEAVYEALNLGLVRIED